MAHFSSDRSWRSFKRGLLNHYVLNGLEVALGLFLVTALVQPLFRLKKESFILRLQALMAPWVMYWLVRAACRMTGSRRKQTVRPTLIWTARQFLSLR